jgi:hypothetical protein
MNPKCRAQLGAARGKPLTDAQAQAIDDRMSATLRQLARTDPQWAGYTRDQRMMLAAQQAATDIKAEAARKVANAQRQALATVEVENRIAESMGRQSKWSRSRALVEDYGRTSSYIDAVKRQYATQLMDLIEASAAKDGAGAGRQALMVLFDAENPLMSRDIALEVFARGEAGTGNALAAKAAKQWLEVTDAMRMRFNSAGGDVGKLDYGYLPQPHDQMRVLAKGQDAWVADVLPLLDRRRYVREDGARMSDAEVTDLLRGAWETIASDGQNKSEPGQFRGTGARANRGGEHRQIHFRDGEAYLAYLNRYGVGSMYDAMIAHVGGLARDIGLIERYGPNPEAQARLQADIAQRTDGPRQGFAGQIAEDLAGPEAQWRVLSGASGMATRATLANVARHVRNVETFGKLQGAVLSSITDIGTYFTTVGYNGLPYFEALQNIGRGRAAKDFLNAHGLIAETLISDLNRWSGEHLSHNWSGRIASATMRLSLMNAWTDRLRRAFQLTMMQGLGRMHGTAWDALTEADRYRLGAKGITADDWAVIQKAQPADWNGSPIVTPEAIRATGEPGADQVATRFLAAVVDESEIAVINPDLTTRAIGTGGGATAGTTGGELARAVAQFKSFPIAMISRHWRRMLDTPQGMHGAPVMANRLAYGGALMVSLTALGAIAFQTKQIVAGKDPVDMTTPKFWTRALAQGGGLGFVGDMLLTDTSDDRSPLDTFGRAVLGPTFGSAADLYELTKGNADEWLAGKDTHLGAEALRFARGHAPLVNLWYAKAALDHAGLGALQENLSPGYLSRIKNQARKQWGQEFWWAPGTGLPERGPSFAEMAGGGG